MPMITTRVDTHPALDHLSVDDPRIREYLVRDLQYKHWNDLQLVIQPLIEERSLRYQIIALAMRTRPNRDQPHRPIYELVTIIAHLDEADCPLGDVVAPEALAGAPAVEKVMPYFRWNVAVLNHRTVGEFPVVSMDETPNRPSLDWPFPERQYAPKILQTFDHSGYFQIKLWERVL